MVICTKHDTTLWREKWTQGRVSEGVGGSHETIPRASTQSGGLGAERTHTDLVEGGEEARGWGDGSISQVLAT